MNILQTLLGNYHYYFIIGALEVSFLFVYFLVLTRKKRRKELGVFRLITCYIYQLFICLAISFIRTTNDTFAMRIFYEIAILIMLLVTLFFCYEENVSEILLCFSSIVAAKNFSGTAIPLIRNLLGNNDLDSITFFSDFVPARDWPIYYGIQIIFLVVISYFFQRGELHQEETLDITGSLLLACTVFIIRGILYPITRHYQPISFELSICIKILMLILYILIIATRAGLLSRKKILSELQTTEQLLLQEKKRYEEMRNNIEIINMKCHDIKKQLSSLHGKLTQNEIIALQEAIKIYDSNINTGNEILDTILYQKKLYCEQNNINLSWLTDGTALSFITPSKLYALLANALENAIEAVLKLDMNKRIISLTVIQEPKSVSINVTNFYDIDSIPSAGTNKKDKVHHGFGLKSMKYIVEEYNGSLEISTENDIFYLSITLPFPKDYLSSSNEKKS